ncbi:GNAT family N-acetyltransferase [Bradyrhizobium sp. G127]|uniref:GNAT family N-acetyltransferase n=1 Tax=Bradyrhizobium sp. G127 TaxID=2904800 RepID=UPI001F395299|nr:GNAT family N-acetyltransferase [Bradyrhizobium sp. G127]
MVEIADAAQAAARSEAGFARAQAGADRPAGTAATLPPLDTIAAERWRTLADNAIEPNGFYLPEWELAVNAFAQRRTGVSALTAAGTTAGRDAPHLIGLLPAISAWRAYRLPLPVLVSADPYGELGTPLLDRAHADEAAAKLMAQARAAGAHALILRNIPIDGPVMTAFTRALERSGLAPRILQSHARACLDATRDAEELLRDALGPKKLKELRRQRNRLAEHGEVIFTIATAPDEIARDLDTFLALEASGWKAKRGTALVQDEGDAAFVRRAVHDAAAAGNCEIVTLYAGDTPVASGIVLRHLDRAFYFKMGVDERFAKCSPGVQLTLDLTRHLCADPAITMADSNAMPGHPMIDPIWRGRLAVGDVLIPLSRRDPLIPAIRLGLTLRRLAREPARHLVHFIRKLRETRS